MQRMKSLIAAVTLAAFLSSLALPMAAMASEEGKRNTTLGLGAGAAALLLTQKNKLPGLLVAGGAIYAGTQWQRDIRARHRRERARYYRRLHARYHHHYIHH